MAKVSDYVSSYVYILTYFQSKCCGYGLNFWINVSFSLIFKVKI